MKNISAIAAALSLVAAVAVAPVANAATTPKASAPAACSLKNKKQPCSTKHVAKLSTHKKIEGKKASAEPTKTTAGKKAS